MTLSYKKGNLFDLKSHYAHCISADYALGAGIARQFRDKFDMRNKLIQRHPSPKVGECVLIENTFNLITKDRYYNKPTYTTLRTSLVNLKQQCINLGINNIAMPKIGCGLDKLNWTEVEKMITDIFENTTVNITVCIL